MHAQPRQQFGQHDRFLDVIHPAGGEAINDIFGFRQPGHENHRHSGQRRIGLDAAGGFKSVDARHHGIHQYQIGQFGGQAGQRRQPVAGDAHAITFAFQAIGQEPQAVGRIIDNQDGGALGFGHGVVSPGASFCVSGCVSGCCCANSF